jgi:hypothetical protein
MTDPILEEIWTIKEKLAHEADYDVNSFFENLRRWELQHPHPGAVVHSAEELQQVVADAGSKRMEASALTLKEGPVPKPPRGNK